jgi:hypothetical protein
MGLHGRHPFQGFMYQPAKREPLLRGGEHVVPHVKTLVSLEGWNVGWAIIWEHNYPYNHSILPPTLISV